jgi:hypothetical protein
MSVSTRVCQYTCHSARYDQPESSISDSNMTVTVHYYCAVRTVHYYCAIRTVHYYCAVRTVHYCCAVRTVHYYCAVRTVHYYCAIRTVHYYCAVRTVQLLNTFPTVYESCKRFSTMTRPAAGLTPSHTHSRRSHILTNYHYQLPTLHTSSQPLNSLSIPLLSDLSAKLLSYSHFPMHATCPLRTFLL